jgi:WD40 repeat protein
MIKIQNDELTQWTESIDQGKSQSAGLEMTQEAVFEGIIDPSWKPGDVVLDLYEIKQVFTTGGMGLVYHVHHRNWDIDLIIKSPRPEIIAQAGGAENFVTEAETWVDLGLHPNIVTCHYVRTVGGIPMVFAEYVDGGSLKDWIARGELYKGGPKASLERILDVSMQFAWGLHYAHQKSLVHRDVKPANVLMTKGGSVKVTDFGLAKARYLDAGLSGDGAGSKSGSKSGSSSKNDSPKVQSEQKTKAMMTPAYCSPEQAERAALAAQDTPTSQLPELTTATDVWSWALSVMEMFIGGLTWTTGLAGPMVLEDYLNECNQDKSLQEPLQEGLPDMPQELVSLLKKCLEPNPSNRPQTMDLVISELMEIYGLVVKKQYFRDAPHMMQLRSDGLNNKALSMIDLDKPDEAENLMSQSLSINPMHLETLYNLSLMQWRDGKIDDLEVLDRLNKLRAANPDKALINNLMENVKAERGDYIDSIKLDWFFKKNLLSNIQHSVLMDPTGERLVYLERSELLDDNQKIHRFDISTGKHLHWSIPVHNRVYEYVYAFGYDGIRFALADCSSYDVSIWNLDSGTLMVKLVGHSGEIKAVQFFHDDAYVLTVSDDQTMRIWETHSGQCLKTYHAEHPNSYGIKKIAMNHGETHAVTGSGVIHQNYFVCHLWDLDKGIHCQSFESINNFINRFGFSRDDKFFAAIDSDYSLKLIQVETGKIQSILQGHSSFITSIAFSPDSRVILSGSFDKTVKLWNVDTGSCINTFKLKNDAVISVGFNSDGRQFFAADAGGEIVIWDMIDMSVVKHMHCSSNPPTNLSYSADYKLLISDNYGKMIRSWNPCTGQCIRTIDATKSEIVWMKRSENNHYVATIDESANFTRWNLNAQTNPISPFRLSVPLTGDKAQSNYEAYQKGMIELETAFNTKDYLAALVCAKKVRSICEYESDEALLNFWRKLYPYFGHGALHGMAIKHRMLGHSREISTVDISRDGHYGITGSYDKTIRQWNLINGSCEKIYKGHKTLITAIRYSPDGRYIYSGGLSMDEEDNLPGDSLRSWDTKTGDCLRVFDGVFSDIHCMAISPDGNTLVSAGGSCTGTIQKWDIKTGESLGGIRLAEMEPKGYVSVVRCIEFSSDGRRLIFGGDDNYVRIVDSQTGTMIKTLEGHTSTIHSIAVSRDGKQILSGGGVSKYGCEIRLWDYESGQCIKVMEGHESPVNSLCLSLNGKYAFSGSGNYTKADISLRTWNLESGGQTNLIQNTEGCKSSVISSDDAVLMTTDGEILIAWNLDWNLEGGL